MIMKTLREYINLLESIEQGAAEGSDPRQYAITDSTGKELTLIYADDPNAAIARALELIGSNTELKKSFGLVKMTPRPYFIVQNGQRRGVQEGYTGRETKDGVWRVFKDGEAVAVAGPFKSQAEAAAWIKKQSMKLLKARE